MKYVIEVNTEELQKIMVGLSRLPYCDVARLIIKVEKQAIEQEESVKLAEKVAENEVKE